MFMGSFSPSAARVLSYTRAQQAKELNCPLTQRA
jgi:hypothetical protein